MAWNLHPCVGVAISTLSARGASGQAGVTRLPPCCASERSEEVRRHNLDGSGAALLTLLALSMGEC